VEYEVFLIFIYKKALVLLLVVVLYITSPILRVNTLSIYIYIILTELVQYLYPLLTK